MRQWINLLAESDSPNLLFHSTSVHHAMTIIADNTIKARTGQVGRGMGVSLSRSWDFAATWKTVVFVLDRAKIPNAMANYRWRPQHGEDDPGDEQEVFVLGDIEHLDHVLVSINVTNPAAVKFAKDEPKYWTNPKPADVKRYEAMVSALVDNPKINAWRPPY